MDPITQQTALACAGAAGAEPLYVDDVFSTYLYDGTGAAQTITNGIDLSGEGGMVWTKSRTGVDHHSITDTERGYTKRLRTNVSNGENTYTNSITSFNSDGFSLGTSGQVNQSGSDFASWTFRKSPGFFDVVTWTGDGNAGRTVSHNLGSKPGSIIIKRTDAIQLWSVYHRSVGANDYLVLNENYAATDENTIFNDTEPTSTQFTLGSSNNVNASGGSYVAYLFAHDDQSFGEDGDEAIIKCGSFTATQGTEVDLGFEPQFLLTKSSSATGDWYLVDNMRGWGADQGSNDSFLSANSNAAEVNSTNSLGLTSSGFTSFNAAGQTYIYIAIRRSHKPPESATDVFHADAGTNNSQDGVITTGFPTDWAWFGYRTLGGTYALTTRLTGFANSATTTSGFQTLYTSSTASEAGNAGGYPQYHSPDNTTIKRGGNGHNSAGVSGFFFKRAPGFFDVVTYTGDGTVSQAIDHNLEVTPELMFVKERSTTGGWEVYDSNGGNTKFLTLNGTASYSTNQFSWNNTSPTSTQFTVGSNQNTSSTKYMAYLFATLEGISKVGTYTGAGSGNSVDVDCGFTAGARFVVIKDTEASGNWYVYDSVRGIVSGNDPILFLDTSSAEQTGADDIDPLNAGFTVVSTNSSLNTSGRTYLFFAIA